MEFNKNMEKVDVKKLCRMCAKPVGTYINLLSTNENRRPYTGILEHFTGVSVSSSDELSTLVCTSCLNHLELCEKIKAGVERAQRVQECYIQANSNKSEKLTKQGGLKPGLKIKQENIRGEETQTSTTGTVKKSQINTRLNQNMSPAKIKDTVNWSPENVSPQRIETNNISLPCRVCLNTFTVVTFINHICVTSTLIPCKKCRLNFKTNEDLAEHDADAHKKKRGRKGKFITCIHCDVDFESPETLEIHLLRVARQGQKIYNCDYCTQFYTDADSCEEHMQLEHVKKMKL